MSSEVKSCAHCGEDFKRSGRVSEAQWAKRKYCSKRCACTRSRLSVSDMREMYDAGKSSGEISKVAGVTPQAVRVALKSDGDGLRSLRDAMKLSHNKPGMAEKFSRLATGRRHSEDTRERMRETVGAAHPLWRGGLTLSAGGYLQFTASPANGDHAGKLLHQVVCEWKEGRSLSRGEHVHHIDGNKLNNNPDNLTVMSASDHARLHALQRGFGRAKHA